MYPTIALSCLAGFVVLHLIYFRKIDEKTPGLKLLKAFKLYYGLNRSFVLWSFIATAVLSVALRFGVAQFLSTNVLGFPAPVDGVTNDLTRGGFIIVSFSLGLSIQWVIGWLFRRSSTAEKLPIDANGNLIPPSNI